MTVIAPLLLPVIGALTFMWLKQVPLLVRRDDGEMSLEEIEVACGLRDPDNPNASKLALEVADCLYEYPHKWRRDRYRLIYQTAEKKYIVFWIANSRYGFELQVGNAAFGKDSLNVIYNAFQLSKDQIPVVDFIHTPNLDKYFND